MKRKEAELRSIRVLIAEDHSMVREGLRTFIGATDDIEVVGEASNGAEPVALADRVRPDVVLMDLVMPEVDGIEAVRRIHSAHPEIKLLALTGFAADSTVVPAIKAGAADAPEQLTRREAEVLACLGDGLSNKEIGKRLYIAEKTVKTHVSAVLAKPGATDRTQVALYAVRNARPNVGL